MGIRLDRLATLYIFGPLAYLANKKYEVPILMYHSVADEDERSVRPYYRTATSPASFSEQMQLLAQGGYKTVSVSAAVQYARDGSGPRDPIVAITFDDGYRNFYTSAAPVLAKYGFTATMYLPTNFIGTSTQTFNNRECLKWSEVRELQQQGMTFGSHTMSHPKLYGMRWEQIETELRGSRDVIEQQLGCAVESFAYPYAFPDADAAFKAKLRDLLETNYKNAVCTTIGRCNARSDPYFVRRLPVNSGDDNRFVSAKLRGGYDWVAAPQLAFKFVKNRLAFSGARARA